MLVTQANTDHARRLTTRRARDNAGHTTPTTYLGVDRKSNAHQDGSDRDGGVLTEEVCHPRAAVAPVGRDGFSSRADTRLSQIIWAGD